MDRRLEGGYFLGAGGVSNIHFRHPLVKKTEHPRIIQN